VGALLVEGALHDGCQQFPELAHESQHARRRFLFVKKKNRQKHIWPMGEGRRAR
jgi:hypothetical protein